VRAIEAFLKEHRFLVEPACAASIAPLFLSAVARAEGREGGGGGEGEEEGAFRLSAEEKGAASGGPIVVVVIVCGGNGVSMELLNAWKSKLGLT
jgi:hypothetical protein